MGMTTLIVDSLQFAQSGAGPPEDGMPRGIIEKI